MADVILPYPDHWPSLPQSVQYLKDRSEDYSIESEPEYVIQTDDGYIEFILRNYENDDWQIQPSYPVTAYPRRFDTEKEFLEVYEELLYLLGSDHLHAPSKMMDNIELRGYNYQRNLVYEYTQKGHILSRRPEDSTVNEFSGGGWTLGTDVGKLLSHTKRPSSTENDERYTYYFENAVIIIKNVNGSRRQKIIPVPHKDIILNTLATIDDKTDIAYLSDLMKIQLVNKTV